MRKIWSVNIIITAASRVIRKKIPENNGNIWVDTALTTIDHLVEKGNKVKKTLCVSHAYSTLLNPDHQPDLMIWRASIKFLYVFFAIYETPAIWRDSAKSRGGRRWWLDRVPTCLFSQAKINICHHFLITMTISACKLAWCVIIMDVSYREHIQEVSFWCFLPYSSPWLSLFDRELTEAVLGDTFLFLRPF